MVTCVQKLIRIIISMNSVQLDIGLKPYLVLTKSSLVERILILLQCGYKLMCYSLKRNNLKFSYEVVKIHQLHLVCVWEVIKIINYFIIHLIFVTIHRSTLLFSTIYWSHCTISTNFYLYL